MDAVYAEKDAFNTLNELTHIYAHKHKQIDGRDVDVLFSLSLSPILPNDNCERGGSYHLFPLTQTHILNDTSKTVAVLFLYTNMLLLFKHCIFA